MRCPASSLLGVDAGHAHAPNKAPGPYASGVLTRELTPITVIHNPVTYLTRRTKLDEPTVRHSG